jgi:hypothetical protein
MKKNFVLRLAAGASGLTVLVSAAQTDPADATHPGPALRYDSAFSGYKPWQEIAPGNWRALNDAVAGTAAGHAGHGASPAAAPASSPAAPAHDHGAPATGSRQPGAPGMQGGRHMQGGPMPGGRK